MEPALLSNGRATDQSLTILTSTNNDNDFVMVARKEKVSMWEEISM